MKDVGAPPCRTSRRITVQLADIPTSLDLPAAVVTESALVVGWSGSGLGCSSPDRPVQSVRWLASLGEDEGVEESADLGDGQRDELRVGVRGGGEGGQDGQGEHCQADEPVPAGPAADLVVVQAAPLRYALARSRQS